MAGAEEPTSEAVQEESRLQRWSRRKLAGDVGEQVPPESEHAGQAVDDQASSSAETAVPERSVDELQAAEPAPLPDLDTLGADSDYAGFMAPEVEPDQRRAALRKLFALPQFAVRDGLDDYDHDFTQFEGLGDIVTHEMKRMAEREAQRLAQQVLEADPDDAVEPESFAQAGEDAAHGQPDVEVVTSEQTGQPGQADPQPVNRTA